MIILVAVLSLALCVVGDPMMVVVEDPHMLPAGTFPLGAYPYYPYAPGVHPSYYNSLYRQPPHPHPHQHPHPHPHQHPHPHPHQFAHQQPHHQFSHQQPHQQFSHQQPHVHPHTTPVHPHTHAPPPLQHLVRQPVHRVTPAVHTVRPVAKASRPAVHTIRPARQFRPTALPASFPAAAFPTSFPAAFPGLPTALPVRQPAQAVRVAKPAAQPIHAAPRPAAVHPAQVHPNFRVIPATGQGVFGYHASYPDIFGTPVGGEPIFQATQTPDGRPLIVQYDPVASPVVQHHAQNIHGAADYGYSHPGQFHEAMRDIYGAVTGTYSYIDPEGKEIKVEYIADDKGYRVKTNALPEGPASVTPTDEVRKATEEHLRIVGDIQKEVSRSKRHSTGYPHSHHIMKPVHSLHSGRPAISYIPSVPYSPKPVYRSHPIYVNPHRYPVPQAYPQGYSQGYPQGYPQVYPQHLPYYQPSPYAPTYGRGYGAYHPGPYSHPIHLQQSPIHRIIPYPNRSIHKSVKAVLPAKPSAPSKPLYTLISTSEPEVKVEEKVTTSEE